MQPHNVDQVLGAVYPTLDGQGWIRLVDVMGDEGSIVEAARVSYGKGSLTPEGKPLNEDDAKLLRYLMRHRHTTPFEMVELKFQVYVPMDCWRQWIRHRTASVNEYSTRYTKAIDDRHETYPDRWRTQSVDNKQGSGTYLTEWPENTSLVYKDEEALWYIYIPNGTDTVVLKMPFNREPTPGEYLTYAETGVCESAMHMYGDAVLLGVAREQARKNLPLSTFTKAFWKIDLHNLLHFLALRMDSHAQAEIREYACVIGSIVAKLFPNVWENFKNFRLDAVTLSGEEVRWIANEVYEGEFVFADIIHGSGLQKDPDRKRDLAEFEAKLKRLFGVE